MTTLPKVAFVLEGRCVTALVDTGAAVTVLSSKLMAEINGESKLKLKPVKEQILSAARQRIDVLGKIDLGFRLGPLTGITEFVVMVESACEVILGWEFLRRFKIQVDAEGGRLCIGQHDTLPLLPQSEIPHVCALKENPSAALSLVEGKMSSELTPSQRAELLKVLTQGLFATPEQPFGRVIGYKHAIDTGNAEPVKSGLRRKSPAERKIVEEEVEKLLAYGAIRPSQSPWSSCGTVVPKKDGSPRFCVDYRKLNDLTVKDVHPIPKAQDQLAVLQGCKFFSTMDAASGYWQVELEESAIPKTAFVTPNGLYEWLVMPFGLCNAPATFVRMMHEILAGLVWVTCLVFFDDILVFGKSFEEHNRNLEEVLGRLRKAGLSLKPAKCQFGVKRVEFLGHVVSDQGIHPDEKKVDRLKRFPRPENETQLLSFLGLGGYYRRFIKDFALIASPLHTLAAAKEWKWTDEHEQAFVKLKESLAKDAVQVHPDYKKPFIVDCDASDIGMGAILSQKQDDKSEKIVVLDSRKFSKAEAKWHIREKEALAIIWGLEKFKPYILGTNFTVRTDHSSLEWLLKAKSGRLSRWALRVGEFAPFQIVHRSGKQHGNVDAFTRVFAESEGLPDYAFISNIGYGVALPSREALIAGQTKDKSCNALKEMRHGIVREGVLGLGRRHRWKPVLPYELIEEVARKLHSHALGGHLGARKTLSVMSRHYVVPGGWTKAREAVESCAACQQRKPSQRKYGRMASTPPSVPWKTVAMDFAGPYPRSNSGKAYVLVITDQFTKWVELIATEDQLAETVVQAFYDKIICQHGCPQALLTDNGPQFRSALVESLCAYFNIRKIYSSAYYPQGDGYAERFMRTLNNSLATLSRQDPANWDKYVPGVKFAYNSAEHEAISVSPFEMNTGRVPRLPGEGTAPGETSEPTHYLKRLRNVISEAHARARTMVQAYWSRMKERYDRSRKELKIKPGELVLVSLTPNERAKFESRKLAPRWSRPAKVVKRLSNGVTFEVEKEDGTRLTVNGTRLLPLKAGSWGGFYGEDLGERKAQPKASATTPKAAEPEDDEEEDVYLVWRPSPTVAASPPQASPPKSLIDDPETQVEAAWTSMTPIPRVSSVGFTSEISPLHQPTPRRMSASRDPSQVRIPRVSGGNREPIPERGSPSLPGGFFYIDKIVGHRKEKGPEGEFVYTVQWLGYGPQHNTEQREKALQQEAPLAIAEYWQERERGIQKARDQTKAKARELPQLPESRKEVPRRKKRGVDRDDQA